MEPFHTFPNSLELTDLAHGPDVFQASDTVYWTLTRQIDGCILCASGFCVQRVERLENGAEHILHGLAPH
jgi:hypothetical protein